MSYPNVQAHPAEFHDVRVNHPTLLAYIRNGIKAGYGNEHICKIVGVPPEIVDRERSKMKKQSQEYK